MASICRLCGFEPFYDERGEHEMFQRILRADYAFVPPWWDAVSKDAKVGKLLMRSAASERYSFVTVCALPFLRGDLC